MNRFTPIPGSELPTMLNKLVHVDGWRHGTTFRLERVEDGIAHLITPTSGRRYKVKASLLQYTRLHEPAQTEGATR